MNRRIRMSLVIALLCLVVGIVLVAVNYAMDNSNGLGYSNSSMNTYDDYKRSLTMVITSIVMATISVTMMIVSLLIIFKRKQAEDEAILRALEEEEAANGHRQE